MADVDTDPFGEHESRPEDPTDENIPLDPCSRVSGPLVTPGRSTWEPEQGEQETSFGGSEELKKRKLVSELQREIFRGSKELPEEFHYDNFKLKDGRLYYKGKRDPLMTKKGNLRMVKEIAKILAIRSLRDLGYDIPAGKITAREFVMLNKAEEELPSTSDIAKADEIELQEIAKSTENLISQMSQTDDSFEGEETLPMQELIGLDKQLRSIRGSLKVEVAKKFQVEECIKKEHHKVEEFREYPGVYDDAMREEITKRINTLNDELATRQKSIDILKGRLKNQITSFKETIAKVLDKDTSLAEKIRTVFREQGITIASIRLSLVIC